MIKFFRRIRQNLITENKFSKYLLYAIGEIVLVVIGILIALSLNNWNEKQNLKAEEIKLLKEMKVALLSDKADIISNIEEHSSAAKSCAILLTAISNKLPYNDSLDFHFANALNTTKFSQISSPYETLKIKGPDLIENDSLRLFLNDYYDNSIRYQFAIQNSSQRAFDAAKERQFELFTSLRFWDKMKPVSYEELLENKYYISWLTYTVGERNWETSTFRKLNEKIDRLLHLLDIEIKKSN
ncbi:hypothetical protein NA63_2713 [Flavobacteriaceae bacterium MAR_2010_105]|nr:hypothetical protein NA63_2713 [Flavobacteriaceae bacterium MAR_2010_105]